MSGKSWCNFSRKVFTYCAVGLWLGFRATRISPSAELIVALSLKARLIPLVGSPMLSSTFWISLGGMTSRITHLLEKIVPESIRAVCLRGLPHANEAGRHRPMGKSRGREMERDNMKQARPRPCRQTQWADVRDTSAMQ